MTLDIRSGEGVGPLQFGMSIRNARAALAEPLLAIGLGWAQTGSFLKDARRDGVPVDDFSKLGLHLYYRVRGEAIVLVAVEMFPPEASPELRGVSLFATPFARVKEHVLQNDPAVSIESGSLRSLALGVAMEDRSSDEEPDAPASSVFAFERGYWDLPLPPVVNR